jgi:hypothetical protein
VSALFLLSSLLAFDLDCHATVVASGLPQLLVQCSRQGLPGGRDEGEGAGGWAAFDMGWSACSAGKLVRTLCRARYMSNRRLAAAAFAGLGVCLFCIPVPRTHCCLMHHTCASLCVCLFPWCRAKSYACHPGHMHLERQLPAQPVPQRGVLLPTERFCTCRSE